MLRQIMFASLLTIGSIVPLANKATAQTSDPTLNGLFKQVSTQAVYRPNYRLPVVQSYQNFPSSGSDLNKLFQQTNQAVYSPINRPIPGIQTYQQLDRDVYGVLQQVNSGGLMNSPLNQPIFRAGTIEQQKNQNLINALSQACYRGNTLACQQWKSLNNVRSQQYNNSIQQYQNFSNTRRYGG